MKGERGQLTVDRGQRRVDRGIFKSFKVGFV